MTATTSRTAPAWSDDEAEAFRELAHSFLAKECAPHEARFAEQQHVDREIWTKAGALGLLCPSIPEEYGGGGGTFAHEAILAEEQVRAAAPSLGTSVHSTIVAHYLNSYGTETQKRTWLPLLATGELVGAVAMTEPGTGSDLQSIKTKAIKQGDEYVLDGSKTFISNGSQAEFVVVVAKTDPENKAAGISLICVDTRGLEGFSRGRVLKKIGQH
ncbi:acyl-CoA dehydrogenase family protein, partial [Jatrophihabitans endophyticus]|uniref:acyl-CoA dehydrogenase family protein n=1 Tax=Jatrophihabitans endophyticus TaxID=1206085 RepID=UPI0019DBC38F